MLMMMLRIMYPVLEACSTNDNDNMVDNDNTNNSTMNML